MWYCWFVDLTKTTLDIPPDKRDWDKWNKDSRRLISGMDHFPIHKIIRFALHNENLMKQYGVSRHVGN